MLRLPWCSETEWNPLRVPWWDLLAGYRPRMNLASNAASWRYTRPPVGQSQLQPWGVKTSGVMPRCYSNFSVPPLDQRARLVPGDCQQKAVECDHDWNGMAPGLAGAFEGYLALLPPVMGLGFRGWGEWGSLLGGCPHRGECRRKSF